MAATPMRTLAVCLAALAAAGCFDMDYAKYPALDRAEHELACPRSELEALRREDLGPSNVEVRGCGAHVIYTCPRGERFACSPRNVEAMTEE
jgi:hypothetical protein